MLAPGWKASIAIGIAIAVWGIGTRSIPCYAQPLSSVPAGENPLVAEFRACDVDGDGQLNDSEYAKRGGREPRVLHREFVVFDANYDGQLSIEEFLCVPVGQSETQMGTIPDPVIQLAERHFSSLNDQWKSFDQNADDVLDAAEFANAKIPSLVAGFESTQFKDWDLNGDGHISHEEALRVLEIGFGIRTPDGGLLRTKSGRVVDWAMFCKLKPNEKGMITKVEYFRVLGPVENQDGWLASIDKNGDGQFDFAEFAQGNHRTNPVEFFIQLDVDLDEKVSLAELDALPEGWRQMAKKSFRGFDDNQDGLLTLREFQLLPHCNILADWQSANDVNNDGLLSFEEFHFLPGLPLSGLTAEYFRRLDVNHDQGLSADEWMFQTKNSGYKFQGLDKNLDAQLSNSEFTALPDRHPDLLSRDFKIFDVNGDGQLSLAEFKSVPYLVSDNERTSPPDPVVELVRSAHEKLMPSWGDWDKNRNESLDSDEFEAAAIGSRIPGLEWTKFDDWDLDHDKKMTPAEIKTVLEIVFGVRTPGGEMLRFPSGRVVDYRQFRGLKADEQGFVDRNEYFRMLGPLDEKEKKRWLSSVDKNHDDRINYAEFAESDHKTDPLASFLSLDADLNGLLTANELEALSPDQAEIARFVFPGFDDNQDGAMSLSEYRLTPMVNLLAPWQSARDLNSDGLLSFDEFSFIYNGQLAVQIPGRPVPEISFATLRAEYFRRLDVDHDKSLSLDEFMFVTSHPSATETEIHVLFANNSRIAISIPDYPIICSPEISPNGEWVAVDGWKHGQSNMAAHVLVASVDSDEVRDLGTGCIPHWSADGRRIAYSKYSGGVFIRDFEGNGEDEELIDRLGWAIDLSPDGKKAVYVTSGNNFTIYDFKTGAKKLVFAAGQSPYNYIEHNFAVSPDSERICFRGHRPNGTIEIAIVKTSGNDPQLRVRCDANMTEPDLVWLSDGKRIMFPQSPLAGQYQQIYEFDPDGDKPPARYPRQAKNRHNGGQCWSRDGKTFVYMSKR